jgi:hypothetical protein
MIKLKRNSWIIKLVLAVVLITLFFSYFTNILLLFSKSKVCGTITEETTVNNNIWVYKYNYVVDGEVFQSGKPTIYFKKNIHTDSLKKINCIEVSYFPYAPYFGTITDKRVLK